MYNYWNHDIMPQYVIRFVYTHEICVPVYFMIIYLWEDTLNS